jgi:hypothetical protein
MLTKHLARKASIFPIPFAGSIGFALPPTTAVTVIRFKFM